MDNFEKVERLVEKANVSFEDAKAALDEANGDLLDAMIILEKRGKVKGPEQSEYVSGKSEQTEYANVSEAVRESARTDKGEAFKGVGGFFRRIFRYLSDNSLRVAKNGNDIINLPLWLSAIIILFTWHVIWIVILVSNDSKAVNTILDQASDIADNVKESFSSKESGGQSGPEDSNK